MKECSGSREAAGNEGISFDAGKRKVAVPNTETGECDGQDEGERAYPG